MTKTALHTQWSGKGEKTHYNRPENAWYSVASFPQCYNIINLQHFLRNLYKPDSDCGLIPEPTIVKMATRV